MHCLCGPFPLPRKKNLYLISANLTTLAPSHKVQTCSTNNYFKPVNWSLMRSGNNIFQERLSGDCGRVRQVPPTTKNSACTPPPPPLQNSKTYIPPPRENPDTCLSVSKTCDGQNGNCIHCSHTLCCLNPHTV